MFLSGSTWLSSHAGAASSSFSASTLLLASRNLSAVCVFKTSARLPEKLPDRGCGRLKAASSSSSGQVCMAVELRAVPLATSFRGTDAPNGEADLGLAWLRGMWGDVGFCVAVALP
jgi:hypothetical protein